MSGLPVREEWDVLTRLLPREWEQLAHATGAMQRARGTITSADLLLQLILLHVATGLSLKQAVVRAHVQGLATVTDVALLKRLRRSGNWLREMARQMFEGSRFSRKPVGVPEGRRLRAIDATTVQEPGATGTDWRVHYSISLPTLECDFYEVTDVGGGETYRRVPVSPGDILLGDRGYGQREGVAHVLRRKGDVIVRISSTGFPLINARDATPFDVLKHLRQLKGHEPGQWAVRFSSAKQIWDARLCAIRKTTVAADKAKRRVQSEAAKKGRQIKPDTLEFAEYVFVLTTLDNKILDAAQILNLYRSRWQIELCFKRFKSLLQLGHLPKRSDESARAWIQGKLLTVLLIERLIVEAHFFSPWGFDLASS